MPIPILTLTLMLMLTTETKLKMETKTMMMMMISSWSRSISVGRKSLSQPSLGDALPHLRGSYVVSSSYHLRDAALDLLPLLVRLYARVFTLAS